ncbi:MerR family transcriptional regulator [Nocardia sp. NPDC057668]|uniref:MerR family transcriptional regulator n=1 Tax=Nocardia sp. NPDC057668 TaxID=3346202 RepID=UPI00366D5CD0
MAAVEYTIDELAREAGTTVRSLRVYHERGVLPPPQVKGRTGYYGADHLNRVHTISRLLERGIKLNGIRELLEAWGRGDGLGEVLGVADSGPDDASGDERPVGDTVTAIALQERLRDVPNGLARVVALGLFEPLDAINYRVADPALVRLLDQLLALDVSMSEALGELERLNAECDRVARRFFELFNRTVVQAYQESERTAADRAALNDRVDSARSLPGSMAAELITRQIGKSFALDIEMADLQD